MKIALVISDFNFDVTSIMAERARRHLEFLGAEVARVVHVPGVFDMPLVVKKLLRRKDVDGVVMIGSVIKGDTNHDELIAAATAGAAVDLALEFDKPLAFSETPVFEPLARARYAHVADSLARLRCTASSERVSDFPFNQMRAPPCENFSH